MSQNLAELTVQEQEGIQEVQQHQLHQIQQLECQALEMAEN